jgi:hypothetical protein
VTGVSDSVNGAWTVVLSVVNTPHTERTSMYYFANAAAGTPTVTATFSANSNYRRISIVEESGVATTTPLDKTASAIGTSTAANSGSVTPASNGQTLAGTLQAASGGVTPGGSWVQRVDDTVHEVVALDQVQVSAASVALTATITSTNWLAMIATFAAPAAGGTNPKGPLNNVFDGPFGGPV